MSETPHSGQSTSNRLHSASLLRGADGMAMLMIRHDGPPIGAGASFAVTPESLILKSAKGLRLHITIDAAMQDMLAPLPALAVMENDAEQAQVIPRAQAEPADAPARLPETASFHDALGTLE